jgi:hypothetical protein
MFPFRGDYGSLEALSSTDSVREGEFRKLFGASHTNEIDEKALKR